MKHLKAKHNSWECSYNGNGFQLKVLISSFGNSVRCNSLNRSIGCQIQTRASQVTPQILHQSVMSSGCRELTKFRLTEFTRDPEECPKWSEIFDLSVHQEQLGDIEYLKHFRGSPRSSESSYIGNVFQLKDLFSSLGYSVRVFPKHLK